MYMSVLAMLLMGANASISTGYEKIPGFPEWCIKTITTCPSPRWINGVKLPMNEPCKKRREIERCPDWMMNETRVGAMDDGGDEYDYDDEWDVTEVGPMHSGTGSMHSGVGAMSSSMGPICIPPARKQTMSTITSDGQVRKSHRCGCPPGMRMTAASSINEWGEEEKSIGCAKATQRSGCFTDDGDELSEGATSAKMQWKWSSRKGGLCKITELTCENGQLETNPFVTRSSRSECRQKLQDIQDLWDSQFGLGMMDSGVGAMSSDGSVGAMSDDLEKLWEEFDEEGKSCRIKGRTIGDGYSLTTREWKWSSRKGHICKTVKYTCDDGEVDEEPKLERKNKLQCLGKGKGKKPKKPIFDDEDDEEDEDEEDLEDIFNDIADIIDGVNDADKKDGSGSESGDGEGWGDDCTYKGKKMFDGQSSTRWKWKGSFKHKGFCRTVTLTCDDGEVIEEPEEMEDMTAQECFRTNRDRRLEMEDEPELKNLDMSA